MRLKYDLTVGALYIRLSDAVVARTRDIDDNTFVDLGEAGDVVGIEVVSIAHPWALDTVLRDYRIPTTEEAQLRAYFKPTVAGAAQEAPTVTVDRNAPVCVAA